MVDLIIEEENICFGQIPIELFSKGLSWIPFCLKVVTGSGFFFLVEFTPTQPGSSTLQVMF